MLTGVIISVKCAVDVSLLRNVCDWRLSGDGVHTAGMVVAVMRPATFGLFSVTAGNVGHSITCV